ncbi:putative Zn-dependent protease [Balneicella halophila]|uniref:Putative Zn-dependent protease n=1 Tax=Balneicella halophila TaxID=1537566 RepID=A0A7L4UNM4_BALHA|nr:M48 family metalloprotease [Balneicella halophila]PVX50701.1 putative Zn-dependent protease [Balneicella halophila]
MKNTSLLLKAIALIFIAFLLHSCAVNPVTGKNELMFISEEQELAMGKQYNPQVVATMGLYEDKQLQEFIDRKGNEMAKISHRPNLPYKFQIVDSPVVNAFAVPGGYVYFTRGIMAHFNSEAEFMGVLGHELGHITARHSAAQQSKQTLYSGLLVGGMVAFPELQQFGNLATQGLQLLFLKHSRDDETQSDRLGVEYSTKVGYNAKEMADFFQVLERLQLRDNPQGIPTYLSTHPNPANRNIAVKQQAEKWQNSLNTSDNLKVGRDRYLRMIDGIIFGEDPRQGYVENGVFYHPELKFEFPVPRGWQLQNTPQQVQMAPKDGKAMMMFTLAGKGDLKNSAQTSLQQLKLQVRENKETTINDFPALITVSSQMGKDQQGRNVEQVRVLSSFIKYGETVYAFHGVAIPKSFNSYYNTFENTMNQFARLTDYSKMNRKPDRIRVKTVSRSTTVEQALRSFGVPNKDLANLAILNNMNLTDRVEAGTLLKTIGK